MFRVIGGVRTDQRVRQLQQPQQRFVLDGLFSAVGVEDAFLPFDDIQGRRRYRGLPAYGQSKLANILFTSELARRLAGTSVTANALHPGYVSTSFFGNNGAVGHVMGIGSRIFGIRPEQGARTSIYLATSPEVEGVTGRYFSGCKAVRPSRAARDESAARRLWQWSEEMTGLAHAPSA